MRTTKLFFTTLIITAIIFTFGCRKESVSITTDNIIQSSAKLNKPVQRAYRDSFDTWYQFIPDFANGWDAANPTPFLAWYPGGGDGNAAHIGNCKTYFNQYVPFDPPLFSSVAAPVTQFFAGLLSAAGYNNIPDAVSYIVYDDRGNSIWFRQTSNSSTPISEVRINFTGTSDIIGGTGNFSGATGEITFNGFFNPQDQQDASVWDHGWIKY